MQTPQQVHNLYKPQKKTLKSILNPNKNRSTSTQVKNTSLIQVYKPEKQMFEINHLKKFNNKILKHNPQSEEGNKNNAPQLSQRKNETSKEKNNKEFNLSYTNFKQTENNNSELKYSKLMYLQNKKKERSVKWDVQREALRLKALQQKMDLQQKLFENKKNSEALNRIFEERKKQQMKFKHSINMDKFQMIRTARKQVQTSEYQIINEKQKESWKQMKFKQQNSKRLSNERKKLEIDTRLDYQRTRLAKLKLSEH